MTAEQWIAVVLAYLRRQKERRQAQAEESEQ